MTGAVAALVGASAVSITVSPSSADGVSSASVVTSDTVTATIVGGAATSASWVRVSGSASINATAPSSETTAFTSVFSSPEARTASFVYEAVVNGVTYQSAPVPVNLERT
jgi:hypothetical protein